MLQGVCGEFAIHYADPQESKPCQSGSDGYDDSMRDVAILLIHLIATVAKLIGTGGARTIVAESLLVKHQLLILITGPEPERPTFGRSTG